VSHSSCSTQTTFQISRVPRFGHAPGDYTVVLRGFQAGVPGGIAATTLVHVVEQVYYVAIGSATPSAPYHSWQTAANNIQDAVDAATLPGALILVSNGVYATGGRAAYGSMTNRVVIDKPVSVRSVNGPEVTVIEGRHAREGGAGDDAVRCVLLTNNPAPIALCCGTAQLEPRATWKRPEQSQMGWPSPGAAWKAERIFWSMPATLSPDPGFSAVKNDITGLVGTTTHLDSTATNGGPFFYCVGVQE
jgi:hypothetical protein